LLNWLLEAFGSQPGVRIRIEKVNVRRTYDDMVLLTYEELQFRPNDTNRRLSSAVFVTGPGGVGTSRWFHLHEVSLENASLHPFAAPQINEF
jgi:hypothetical protein